MAKNTPTPWEVCGDHPLDESVYVRRSDDDQISADDPHCIMNPDDEIEAQRANAKLIVKAVNCHDELLDALEEAILSHITMKTSHYMAKSVLNGIPLPSNVDFPNWVIGGVLAIKKARGSNV